MIRLAVAATLGVLPVAAWPIQAALNVTVSVTLVSSSGPCGVVRTAPAAVAVDCKMASGGVLQWGGSTLPLLPSSTLPAPAEVQANRDAAAPLNVLNVPTIMGTNGFTVTGGIDVASWRVVSLDNGTYVELTIAW